MKLFDSILDWLFPSRCAFCRRLTQDRAMLCPRCREKLPYTGSAARQSFPHLDDCCSPLYYVDEVRSSLLRYKFGGASMYAEIYGEILAKCIDENHISCDSITWVPLSRQRLRKRLNLRYVAVKEWADSPCQVSTTLSVNQPSTRLLARCYAKIWRNS